MPRVLYVSTVAAGAYAHESRHHAGDVIAALGTDEIYVKTRQTPGAAARGGSRPASSCVSTNWLDSPDSLDSLDSLVRNWMR